MYVIKFGYFLLLICVMLVRLLDQLEEPRSLEDSLPLSPTLSPIIKVFVMNVQCWWSGTGTARAQLTLWA